MKIEVSTGDFEDTVIALMSDSRANRLAVVDLRNNRWEPLYNTNGSCWWKHDMSPDISLLANLTVGQVPVVISFTSDKLPVRHEWPHLFGDGEERGERRERYRSNREDGEDEGRRGPYRSRSSRRRYNRRPMSR